MTIEDGGYDVSVRVVPELMEKIFLNIPAEWLNKTIGKVLGMSLMRRNRGHAFQTTQLAVT